MTSTSRGSTSSSAARFGYNQRHNLREIESIVKRDLLLLDTDQADSIGITDAVRRVDSAFERAQLRSSDRVALTVTRSESAASQASPPIVKGRARSKPDRESVPGPERSAASGNELLDA